MKTLDGSTLDISALYGALLINPNGGEFYCVGVGVSLETHTIVMSLVDADDVTRSTDLVAWDYLREWEVQLRPRRRALETG
jgi:hypothetical protein